RVALASVLAQNVELLLLDEPTGSLDSENSQLVWDSIKQLKDTNLTIIAVSHDKEITELANKSYILDYGIIKSV
ncbi:MAG: ABC transporter ATP-binding protein, partial [Candidatus Heimdallarchaeota archaeon]